MPRAGPDPACTWAPPSLLGESRPQSTEEHRPQGLGTAGEAEALGTGSRSLEGAGRRAPGADIRPSEAHRPRLGAGKARGGRPIFASRMWLWVSASPEIGHQASRLQRGLREAWTGGRWGPHGLGRL